MSRINNVFVAFDPDYKPLRVFTRYSSSASYGNTYCASTVYVARCELIRETAEQIMLGESNTDLIPRADLDKVSLIIGEGEGSPLSSVFKAVVHQDTAEYVVEHSNFEGVKNVRIVQDVPLLRVDPRQARILAYIDTLDRSRPRALRSDGAPLPR